MCNVEEEKERCTQCGNVIEKGEEGYVDYRIKEIKQ